MVKIAEETMAVVRKLYNRGRTVPEIAERIGVSVKTVSSYITVVKQGYNSYSEYREYLAKQKGYNSYSEYKEHLAKQKGYKSLHEYQEHLAKQKGYNSYSEYQEHLAKKRQKKLVNSKLGRLIKTRLKELGESQSWLAEQIGVTRQAVSLYINGRNIPKEDIAGRIFSALQTGYNTIDDLLE